MKKSIGIIIAVAIVIVAGTAAYGLYVNHQKATKETPSKMADTSASQTSSTSGSRDVAIPKWSVQFNLPNTIDVTEIRMAKDTSVNTDALIIGSSKVASSYDHTKCSGNNLALGEIFSIFRFDSPKDGAKKIGNSYYKVVEPLATSECYDSAIWQKYFDNSVRGRASDTLRAS